MINMDLRYIASQYVMGEIMNCTTMQQGTSSTAMLLQTTSGSYVLRQLRDERQALAEYEVYQALAPAKLSPSIQCTKEGLSYITLGHMIYNVQTYIDKVVPQHSLSLNYVELGEVIARFHQRIMHLDMTRLGQEDRFALALLWEAVSGKCWIHHQR
ncbi:phosphotransferase [Paenibacillus sp. DCT19]|uniref:phosphotransferase n=1 Tax=Paenibacillus sp. DCT19 TaxID=2211212 RepID=UPI000FE23350|nr:phosphotransferase [Paenibacillus sp. DCT19]